MPFGPYFLKKSFIDDDCFILELADSDGIVRYRPRRFVSFSRHELMLAKAKRLEGKLVVTETSNPQKNPPEKWWVDVNEYRGGATPSIANASVETKFTQEQLQCIEKFQTSSQLKISAFAGAGKTTTLLGIANSAPNKKGLYLAFNKEIADEAMKKFPKNVDCRTTHSLAYQFAASRYSREKLSGGMNAVRCAELLNLQPINLGENRNYSARQVGQWVAETLQNFCQSDSQEFGPQHAACERLRYIKNDSDIEELKNFLIQSAQYIWHQAVDASTSVPLGHDGYLKLWSISQPKLEHDFIMLDEAQDTNAAVIYALSKQSGKTVYVGDKYQQIYGFRGAFNAMERIHVDAEASLTTSFRFGEPIAEVANAIIRKFGEKRQIVGNSAVTSNVNTSPAKAFIYRTNMGVLDGLANSINSKKRPYLAGGTNELLALIHDIELMQAGHPAISNADFFGFKHWLDLVGYSKSEEGGAFQTIVQVIEKYGTSQLRSMLQEVVTSAEQADLILTTAHKSKGKEWDHVEVCDDFVTKVRADNLRMEQYKFDHPMVEEVTLLYVALTRAKISLNIPDRILSILGLHKYINGLFPTETHPSTSAEVTPLSSEKSSETKKPLIPTLPKQFIPSAGSIKARDDYMAETTQSMHLADMANKQSAGDPKSRPRSNQTSSLVSENKLQELQNKFKK
jgi:UvrD/REP helicase N-terminal domain/UvrD-like helicase C-terminal domain